DKDKPITVQPLFVKQDIHTNFLTFCSGKEYNDINSRFIYTSKVINDELSLTRKWEEFIAKKENEYLRKLSGNSFINNKYVKFILNKLDVTLINRNYAKNILNLLRCESHRELSIEVLSKYLNNKSN